MNNSGFISSEIDFSESQVSQLSKYDFEMKNGNFEADDTVINNTISEGGDSSYKDFDEVIKTGAKKLYMKDLEPLKDSTSTLLNKIGGKQNNIPNTYQPSTQSRRIIIHKNTSTVIPYRSPQSVDESFTTNKIVQLQEQLIQLRKQLALKESLWIKEKSLLMGKIEMGNFEVAEMKQRNNNLIQINQTLTQALGETNKNNVVGEYEKRIDELGKEVGQKNKKIQALEESLSRVDKEKNECNTKLKEQKEKVQHLTKTLEEYKLLVKESNQRKFQTDERMVMLAKNIQVIKRKLNQLPIKNEYLSPIFELLNRLKEGSYLPNNQQEIRGVSGNKNNESGLNISNMQFSQMKRPQHNNGKVLRGNNKPIYAEQQSFINQINGDNSNYYENENQESNYFRESDFNQNERNHQQHNQHQYQQHNNSYFFKNNQQTNHQNYTTNNRRNTFANKINHAKRIDTSQEHEQSQYSNNNQDDYYPSQQQQFYKPEQEQVYLCEICQRVYPHEQFINHMKDCQQYEQLIKQKKQIESKLISIKEQQYENRKSNMSSLNSSAIVLGKSRSKGKFVRVNENAGNGDGRITGRTSNKMNKQYHVHSNNERRDRTGRNGNRTERYVQRDQQQDNSRLQISSIMNISSISPRPSNQGSQRPKHSKQPLTIIPNQFYSQTDSPSQLFAPSSYKPKPNPQIKYQTNMPSHNNNIGKESMQEEIRKIVEAINQGKSKNKQQFNQSRIQTNKKDLSARMNRNNPNRAEFY